MGSSAHHGDQNKMGRWGATSYIVGNIVGSGIFITPTSILNHTQSVGLAMLVWALCALLAVLGAHCYIELGTSIRRSGGDFAYLCYVEWRSVAFAFMACGCLLTFPLAMAIEAETCAEYLLQALGVNACAGGGWAALMARKCIGYGIDWLLLYLNFFSLGTAVARFQIVSAVAKLLAAGLIIGIGMYQLIIRGQTENLRTPFHNSTWEPGHLSEAFFAGLFSYDGWDILNLGAEELANPRGTLSFAILVGLAMVAGTYLAMNLSFYVVLTVPQIQASSAVATTFAQQTLGHGFQYLMPLLVCTVLIGSMNSILFMASRSLFAAARERQLPAFLSCTNARHNSPRAALAFYICLTIVLSFLGNVDQLISYVSFVLWFQRCFTMCALLMIRLRRTPPVHAEAIRMPLTVPLTFLCCCLALVGVTVARNFGTARVGLAMLAGTLALHALVLRERAPLGGTLLRHRWVRRANDKLAIFVQIVFDGQIWLNEDIVDGNPIEMGTEERRRLSG